MLNKINGAGVLMLMMLALPAEAQLSTNPWVNPNTDESVAEVYQKNRHQSQPIAYYGDNTVLEERPIFPEETQPQAKEDDGMFDKLKNMLHNDDKPAQQQVAQTSRPQRRIIRGGKKISRRPQRSSASASSAGSTDFGFDFNDFGGNFSGVINKVQRVITNNLNAITRQFK